MIRSTVRKKGFLAAALPMLFSAGFVALACETPTPPASSDPEIAVEASGAPGLERSAVPTEVSEGEDGYFLVRKDGGKVKYVGPVSEDQLQLVQEGEAGKAFYVRNPPDEALDSKTEQHKAQGTVVRLREGEGDEGIPKPLIVLDGVIVSDPDFLDTMDKESIDRIEVIKGAAAEQLYGERAVGGVIKIFTKR